MRNGLPRRLTTFLGRTIGLLPPQEALPPTRLARHPHGVGRAGHHYPRLPLLTLLFAPGADVKGVMVPMHPLYGVQCSHDL
jgi:hypothetical protein